VNALETFWKEHPFLETLVSRGVKVVVILAGYWIARQILSRTIDIALARLMARPEAAARSVDHGNRLRTLQGLVKSLVGYVLAFVFIIMLLEAVELNVTGLITTAGIGGLAIGFGAQKLVRDVISGFFIIVEDHFAVGDYVTIGAATGVVEEMGTRTTRLRDDQGRVWILSNGDISMVTNHSRAPVEAFIDIGIAPGADVEKAQAAINVVGETLYREEGHHLLSAPRALGVSAFDAVRTTIRVAVAADPRALTTEQLRVREAIQKRFLEEEIPIA